MCKIWQDLNLLTDHLANFFIQKPRGSVSLKFWGCELFQRSTTWENVCRIPLSNGLPGWFFSTLFVINGRRWQSDLYIHKIIIWPLLQKRLCRRMTRGSTAAKIVCVINVPIKTAINSDFEMNDSLSPCLDSSFFKFIFYFAWMKDAFVLCTK